MIARLRPAHGVALLFLANGLSHPSLWPRLPEIRDAVGASDATLGLALLGTGVGGVLGSVLAPRISRTLGIDRAATISAAALAVLTIGVGVSPTVPALFVAFALMGMTDGVADISQNALMFDVQRTGERSLASRMHAVCSIGALTGTGIGTLAATARISVTVQASALALVACGLALVARLPVRHLGPVRDRDGEAPVAPVAPGVAAPASPANLPVGADATAASTGPASDTRGAPDATGASAPLLNGRRLRVWALVALTGLVVAAVESLANEWSALTLRDGLGATVALAGLGPTAYAGAMLAGRLVGDRAIDRYGARAVARAGGAAVALGGGVGLGLAAWLQVPAVLVAGLIVAGVGTATLFPLMLAAGDALDPSGRGVAAASLGARAGFLVVPVSVGLLSDAAGPAVAFALLPLAGLAAATLLPAALARGSGR